MNVLFVIDTLQTGGAEKSILEITTRFTKFQPIICTLFSSKADLKEEFLRRQIPVIELQLQGRFWLFTGIKKLKDVVEEVRPAIVHANLFRAELITRLAVDKNVQIHIGSFVNDSYSLERYQQQDLLTNLKLNAYRLIDALTAQRATHFTSITKAIASTNAKALGLNAEKITTIYRGRSSYDYIVNHPSIEEDKPFVFLAVARLLKRKGYVELINAAKILKQKLTYFRVLVAGEGPDRKFFLDLIKQLSLESNFVFLGTRSDVPDLLKDAHCFVFPSHYEGQGGALVEAMLAAKPIIATRIPVIEEQLADEETAKLFALFDASDLAEKMLWMYNNYSIGVDMGIRAKRVAEERFNIESIAEQHELLYTKLLEARG